MPNTVNSFFNELDQYVDLNFDDQKFKSLLSRLAKLVNILADVIKVNELIEFNGYEEKLREVSSKLEKPQAKVDFRKSGLVSAEKVLEPSDQLKTTLRELIYILQTIFQFKTLFDFINPNAINLENLDSLHVKSVIFLTNFIEIFKPTLSINLQKNIITDNFIEILKQPNDIFIITKNTFEILPENIQAAHDLAIVAAYNLWVVNAADDEKRHPIIPVLKDYIKLAKFNLSTKNQLPSTKLAEELLSSLSPAKAKQLQTYKTDQAGGVQIVFFDESMKLKSEMFNSLYSYVGYYDSELTKPNLAFLQAFSWPIIQAHLCEINSVNRLKNLEESFQICLKSFQLKNLKLENTKIKPLDYVKNSLRSISKNNSPGFFSKLLGTKDPIEDVIKICRFYINMQPVTASSLQTLVELYAFLHANNKINKELYQVIYYYRYQLTAMDRLTFILYSLKQQIAQNNLDKKIFNIQLEELLIDTDNVLEFLSDNNKALPVEAIEAKITSKFLIEELQKYFGYEQIKIWKTRRVNNFISLNTLHTYSMLVLNAIYAEDVVQSEEFFKSFCQHIVNNKDFLAAGKIDFAGKIDKESMQLENKQKMSALDIINIVMAEYIAYSKNNQNIKTSFINHQFISLDILQSIAMRILQAIAKSDLQNAKRLWDALSFLIKNRSVETGKVLMPTKIVIQMTKIGQKFIPSYKTEDFQMMNGEEIVNFVSQQLLDSGVVIGTQSVLLEEATLTNFEFEETIKKLTSGEAFNLDNQLSDNQVDIAQGDQIQDLVSFALAESSFESVSESNSDSDSDSEESPNVAVNELDFMNESIEAKLGLNSNITPSDFVTLHSIQSYGFLVLHAIHTYDADNAEVNFKKLLDITAYEKRIMTGTISFPIKLDENSLAILETKELTGIQIKEFIYDMYNEFIQITNANKALVSLERVKTIALQIQYEHSKDNMEKLISLFDDFFKLTNNAIIEEGVTTFPMTVKYLSIKPGTRTLASFIPGDFKEMTGNEIVNFIQEKFLIFESENKSGYLNNVISNLSDFSSSP